MRSVCWFLLVHMMIGMFCVAGSFESARVSWKPFWPGITTSIRIRSGDTAFTLIIASSAFSAAETAKPFLASSSVRKKRSVGESSTIKTFFTLIRAPRTTCSVHRMLSHRGQQAVLGERLRQVLARTHHAPARPVEQSVLGRKHHDRSLVKARAALDQRAGLVTIEPRHQDVAEDDVR